MNKCIGCGSILQDTIENKDGYVLDINDKLCQRCFRIRYYNEYKNTIRDNNDYLKILDSINNDDLVVYVTSLLDIRLDYIDSFKNVIVVLTKRDILPKSVKDEKLIKYIKSRYNPLEVIVVSSVKNYNIDYLFDILRQYKKKNIYVVGTTNGGKSTLINKLIKNYSIDKEPSITISPMPSTTLNEIEINLNKFTLVDTPGLVDNGNVLNYVKEEMVKKLIPKQEIKTRTYQLKHKESLIVDTLFRLDYLNDFKNSFTFFISNDIDIKKISSKKNLELKDKHIRKIKVGIREDICINGLGFIKVIDPCEVNIYIDKDIEVYTRKSLI